MSATPCDLCNPPAPTTCVRCEARRPVAYPLADDLNASGGPRFERMSTAVLTAALAVEEWLQEFGHWSISREDWVGKFYAGRPARTSEKAWERLHARLRLDGYPFERWPDPDRACMLLTKLLPGAGEWAKRIRELGPAKPPGYELGTIYRGPAERGGKLFVAVDGGWLVGPLERFKPAGGTYTAARDVDVAGLCRAWGLGQHAAEIGGELDEILGPYFPTGRA